jgi:hypothetical protein
MGCGKKRYWLETHEIERRSQATHGRWEHVCNYLLLCRQCHAGEFSAMPHARQLAYKLHWDPQCYNLQEWLRLKDPELNAPKRVTTFEVLVEWHTLMEKFA